MSHKDYENSLNGNVEQQENISHFRLKKPHKTMFSKRTNDYNFKNLKTHIFIPNQVSVTHVRNNRNLFQNKTPAVQLKTQPSKNPIQFAPTAKNKLISFSSPMRSTENKRPKK